MATVSASPYKWLSVLFILYISIRCFVREVRVRKVKDQGYQNLHDSSSADFVPVVEGTSDVFVWSAFKIGGNIDIVSIVDLSAPVRTLKCIFWLDGVPDLTTQITASLHYCPESHGQRFTAAFYSCKMPTSRVPHAVSLVTDDCKQPISALPVIYNSKIERNFTVCVSPLHSRFSKAYQLVEMVEVSRSLGADHFFFYNFSTDWNVNTLLEHYESKGIASIIQWPLPMMRNGSDSRESNEIHYFGQLAMLNDCLNRNRGISKYVVFQDLDELIIPKNHKSWYHLIQTLPRNASSYMFRSSFFRLDWPHVTSDHNLTEIAKSYKSYAFLTLFREDKVYGRAIRSKYMVDPLQVEVVGIHNVWKFKRGGRPYYVPPSAALVHHYRVDQSDATRRKDDSILNFWSALQNIQKTWQSLRDVPLGLDSSHQRAH